MGQNLEGELQELQKKKEEKMKDKAVQQLQMFRQQATLTANRKQKFLEELQSTKEETMKVKHAIAAKEEDLHRVSNKKFLKGEDFDKYANSLRGKSTRYKAMKAELNELRSEFGVLQLTEEIMKGKVDLKEYQGIMTTKKELDSVNKTRAKLDGQKSETLEELSRIVQEFVSNIRERRNKLAPQILELRNTRQQAQVIEREYEERKEKYESEERRLQAETGKLEDEVNQLTQECRLNESLYHRLNCQLNIAQAAEKRVQDEKDFLSGARRLDESHKSWTDMFDKKRQIESTRTEHLQQMDWFRDLKRLLECKVTYYKREANEKKGHGDIGAMGDMGGVMMGDMGAANVLVLGQGSS